MNQHHWGRARRASSDAVSKTNAQIELKFGRNVRHAKMCQLKIISSDVAQKEPLEPHIFEFSQIWFTFEPLV